MTEIQSSAGADVLKAIPITGRLGSSQDRHGVKPTMSVSDTGLNIILNEGIVILHLAGV
jgi:hypothetical protein